MLCTTLAASALAMLLGTGSIENEKSFEKELEKARALMDRGRWKVAKQALVGLLEAHEDAPYLRKHRTALQSDLRKAYFWSTHEEPDPKDLISGELLSWNRNSGQVKLRYGPDNLEDWEQQGNPKRSTTKRSVLVHPMTFAGTFSLEVEVDNYFTFGKAPMFAIGYDTEEPVYVIFGQKKEASGSAISWLPAKIFVGGSRDSLAEKRSALKSGERTKLRATVKSGSVTAYGNGRKLVSAKRKAGLYGKLALLDVWEIRKIEITGTAQSSWFEGLVDEAMQDEWKRFDENFVWEDHVPAWLVPGEASEEYDPDSLLTEYPGRGANRTLDGLFGEVQEHRKKGQFGKANALLDHANAAEMPESFRYFVRAYLAQAQNDLPKAIELLTQTLIAEPEHRASRYLRAFFLALDGRGEEGIGDLEALLAENPQDPEVVSFLATCHLYAEQASEANRVVQEALKRGVDPLSLDGIAKLLHKAEGGPDWNEVHDYQSKHYHVSSDIDAKICNEAAKHLESSLNRFNRDLRRLPRSEERYRVFLFAGEQGYLTHLGNVLGSAPENTAGVYSQQLKQLLIWNLPDRERMFRTIRHEGFHQYFDRLVQNSPRWLNEGLAEYYENAKLVGGQWKQDHAHPDHIGALQDHIFKDWEEFVEAGPGAFYANEHSYSYAWLLVHFLLHSTRENHDRFDRMIDVLSAGGRSEEGLEAAFGDINWRRYRLEIQDHIDKF